MSFSLNSIPIAVDNTEGSATQDLKSQMGSSKLHDSVDDTNSVQTLPFLDESVAGYVDDVTPEKGGREYVLDIVRDLQSKGIPSCLVQNAALIYYGALRYRWVRLSSSIRLMVSKLYLGMGLVCT